MFSNRSVTQFLANFKSVASLNSASIHVKKYGKFIFKIKKQLTSTRKSADMSFLLPRGWATINPEALSAIQCAAQPSTILFSHYKLNRGGKHRPHPAKISKEEHVFILSLILVLYTSAGKVISHIRREERQRERIIRGCQKGCVS